ALERLHEGEDFLYALCMVQKAYLASFEGDAQSMRHYTDRALAALPEDERYLRGMMCQVQAAACFNADPLQSKSSFLKTVKLQCGLGNKTLSCSAYCNLATVCANLGHFDEARSYANLSFSLYEPRERRFKPMLSYAYLAKMACAYEVGSFDEVLDSYGQLESVSAKGIVPERYAEAQTIKAKALFRIGSAEAAPLFLEALAAQGPGALQGYPTLPMVRDFCDKHRMQAIEQAASESDRRQVRLFGYALAYFLGQMSRCEEACVFAEALNAEDRLAKVHALFVAALFSECVAQHASAEVYLDEALLLCAAYGFSETVEGNAEILRPLAHRMAAVRGREAHPLLIRVSAAPAVSSAEGLLTDRETDVMRLVASGTTIAEAAAQLYLSRDTVKKHLANVYAKLGVHSKMQAVALLRERGEIWDR
ncbi:helix-turn-helix transcriptional regulator, partial [Gordonibacter sp.]